MIEIVTQNARLAAARTRRGTGSSPGLYNAAMPDMSPIDAFGLLDMRVGRITRVEHNDKARKPSYQLWIDFGDLGERASSAQITDLYTRGELVGKLIIAAMNLGTRKIAGFESQVLVLGLPDAQGRVVLLEPERDVPLGGRVF